jgi:hypothetical protein
MSIPACPRLDPGILALPEFMGLNQRSLKDNNKVKLSKLVSYPLEREYPIPDIRNEREFIARFDQVFDQSLSRIIVNSNIRKDWNEVGWRGIMLNDGDLWLDHDGKISSVNYQSNAEKNLKNQIAAKGRRALHRSVNNFAESVLEWKTRRFHVRVDDLGEGKLRYSAWPIGKKTTNKPDIVLTGGKVIYDDSGRNHRYVFDNGNFSYQLKVNNIGSISTPPGALEVYKGKQRFISEVAMEVNSR